MALSSASYEIGLDGRSRIASQTDQLTGAVTTFSYDSNNQMSSSVTTRSGTTLSSTTYEIGVDGQARASQSTDNLTGQVTTFN